MVVNRDPAKSKKNPASNPYPTLLRNLMLPQLKSELIDAVGARELTHLVALAHGNV